MMDNTSVAPKLLIVSELVAPAAASKRIVSTPAPAFTTSLPAPGMIVVLPAPELIVSAPDPVDTKLVPAPKVTVSLLVPVVMVNKPAVAAVGAVTVTPVAAVPPAPLPVDNVMAPVAAEASTVAMVVEPTASNTVKACEPVMFSLVMPVSVNDFKELAEVAELTVNVSTPAVVKEEPEALVAVVPFSVNVAASAVPALPVVE